MKSVLATTFAAAVLAAACPSLNAAMPQTHHKLDTAPEATAKPFALSQVRLLDGPFKDALELNKKYLLDLDPDRLLSGFFTEAGLKPKAEKYGGWEQQGIAGHSLGHYLSAVAMTYAATGDERFKERADYIVDQLARAQEANGNGYVGAIPDGKRIWREVKAGEIESEGFSLNGGWVPWYTQHKVFAGLVDAYAFTDSEEAKKVLVALADWANNTVGGLSQEQMQKMLAAEHGGMNESLANVYAMTGDEKYLELAKKFTHRFIFEPLADGRDELTGQHANTQVPKLVGAARIYALTGDEYFKRAADTFWETVVDHRTFAQGGNSDHEHFFPPDRARHNLSAATAETCNVYNMLRLTKELFALTPDRDEADFFEKALFNQILGSQDPKRGMYTYFQSLRPGHFKVYSDETNAFWCCVGTGMENHARYGEGIYFHNDDSLWVNQFIASELKWQEKGLAIRQETDFPESDKTTLTVEAEQPTKLTLRLRVPVWVDGTPALKVNGETAEINVEEGYATIRRTWKSGDTVEWTVPMGLRTESLEGAPDMLAFLYGPVTLAGDLGTSGLESVEFYLDGHSQNKYGSMPTPEVPVLVGTPEELISSIEKVDGEPLTFELPVAGGEKVTLRPFADTHFVRYTVYWKTYADQAAFDAEQARAEAEAEAQRQLEARSIDVIRPGEQQPEVDHNYEGKNSSSGVAGVGRWRHAVDGGYFQYDVKVDPEAKNILLVKYFGSDGGNRRFDILVDGTKIASKVLRAEKPSELIEDAYPIPADLVDGKEKVTVRFQAEPGSTAGGIFGLRVVRGE